MMRKAGNNMPVKTGDSIRDHGGGIHLSLFPVQKGFVGSDLQLELLVVADRL